MGICIDASDVHGVEMELALRLVHGGNDQFFCVGIIMVLVAAY